MWTRPIITTALLSMTLPGCASVSTQLPDITLPQLKSEQIVQEASAFAELSRLKADLDRVAFPVLRANTALCPKTKYDIGLQTHSLKSYSKALRPAAAREIAAASTPSIVYVRPGSGADKAGVKAGDEILNEDNKAVSATAKSLQAMFKDGTRKIRIRRGADVRDVDVEPTEVCGYPVRLSMSGTVNAYANGRSIRITQGMMKFVKSDAELAMVVGHELAHNTMGHIPKVVKNVILTGFATRYTRPFELESDYVGLYYTARASYSLDNVEDMWRRMALINPRAVARAKTHPTSPDRYLRIALAREEILKKRAAGEPLVPNFIKDNKAPDT
ncbi:M48 family metalloprotease [Fretibacter rubidus]|uniref:M48 family metalloprotease n=1 Tax=Fretibacter rubidus TaxID=570162 RepID=UPI00352A969A